ncbi:hypothetical protein MJO28_002001 [Puccinia striiformis f. sp. tritici]|uniref:Uncharacterized protein n=4 Tax=Puccinia striiformis TaxID=27350 RepID=A0A2S4WBE9_9BASI|nr:hypothetical protein Pst134EA_002762 [Puccinia striiformis f. sp. tritici]KAI9618107.1 hypothetical protein H4Q26_012450 [Puccinia striiformis f. sp. tritici PST-130]POW14099.1 hypothetical protein PSTT_03162 [Puccinia striiformis]KAH9472137.1 hypothetical protein Pst134EA_002762 [Puccinia striiformis f. sp. tritici]KAI7961512.1 hypothetical protein MJO28_002001 [Puccinia striiformis f. sp. tritici]POW19086.1 hypothetical protein PSHT_05122 [Puccinia striiformis]
MKATAFFTILLAGVYSVTAASNPTLTSEVADGFYQVNPGEAGKTTTKFTPWDKVGKSSAKRRSILAKRREHCGPGSVSVNDADAALNCLLYSFKTDVVSLDKGSWTYCVRGDVVAFICPYSGGYKFKSRFAETWSDVRGRCGASILGYGQVSGDVGDWTAGYALKTDNFCTKKFKVGS